MTPARRVAVVLAPLLLLLPASAPLPEPTDDRASFSLLQLNLCSSGLAGCFSPADYPRIVDDTVARIVENDVDAVTLNEACRRDVERIAERTGYDYRFVRVRYDGAPLSCVDPGGRGLFGIAVLSEGAVRSFSQGVFSIGDDREERRWLCVTTARGVDVCTSHLSTGGPALLATNAVQCGELSSLLGTRRGPVVFAGDVNRRASCAPPGFWTLTDGEASETPGLQHAYGSLLAPSLELESTDYTDHDAMVVRALVPRK